MWKFEQECTNSGVFIKDDERTNLQIINDDNDLSSEDLELANTICDLLNNLKLD